MLKPTLYVNRFVNINTDTREQYRANSVMFQNKGTVAVIINNVLRLEPGEVWASNLPQDGVDATEYDFVFAGIGKKLLVVSYSQTTS